MVEISVHACPGFLIQKHGNYAKGHDIVLWTSCSLISCSIRQASVYLPLLPANMNILSPLVLEVSLVSLVLNLPIKLTSSLYQVSQLFLIWSHYCRLEIVYYNNKSVDQGLRVCVDHLPLFHCSPKVPMATQDHHRSSTTF